MTGKTENENQSVTIAVMATDIGYIKKTIESILKQLSDMSENFAKKEDVATIEKDHESRIRRLETWGFSAIGALAVVEFVVTYFKK